MKTSAAIDIDYHYHDCIAAVVAFQDETSAARSSLGLPVFDIAPRISQSTSFPRTLFCT